MYCVGYRHPFYVGLEPSPDGPVLLLTPVGMRIKRFLPNEANDRQMR